jgi:hypothetical protein
MTDPAIIASLKDRRQVLLRKVGELEEAKQLVMLEGKSGRISANARTAKIVAEKTVVDAVLANTESILAEMIAGLGPSSRLAYSCSRMRSGRVLLRKRDDADIIDEATEQLAEYIGDILANPGIKQGCHDDQVVRAVRRLSEVEHRKG